jgi:hypothetical protein
MQSSVYIVYNKNLKYYFYSYLYGELLMEDIGSWIAIYMVLGLLAFIRPWLVHEFKKLLSLVDALTTLMGLLVLYRLALNLQVKEVAKHLCPIIQDFVTSLGLPFVYLMAASLSRAMQFGEFSERTLMRIIIYLLLASTLFVMGSSIRC